eukprot:91072_1
MTAHCTNLADTLRTRIAQGGIQWIQTTRNGYIYIAVEHVNENGNIYRVIMDDDYYAEYHLHTPLDETPKPADKIRIKKKPRHIGDLIFTDPEMISPINEAICNLWNGKDTLSGIRGTQDRALILSAFENVPFYTYEQYKQFSIRQLELQRQAQNRNPTAEQIQAHQQSQAKNKHMDSFDTASGYDYSDIIENNWNHGYVYSQYDQYSDHLKSAKTIDYDSTLLGVCGVITLVLLCLVCFIGALICGYFVGKIVRQIKDSECTPFQIGTENENN